jgi:CRP/FNR family cyclic AMP-dependent transcriptional regulator
MTCKPEVLKGVPLFSLLDDEEIAVLAGQVELKTYAARQRIYKAGDRGLAYVNVSGKVRVTSIDEDHQEVVVDEPAQGEFFGFASMLEQTPHQTNAIALEETVCIEISREDIQTLMVRKPDAGMDLVTTLAHQYHAAHQLVRLRATRNPNEIIEKQETTGERIADNVAGFGGSWTFIIMFSVVLSIYTLVNIFLGGKAWDPYPFILLNLFLSMLAAIQAPVIMMSQNRQDTKDRVRSELDFEVNRRSELEIQGLSRKLHLLDERIDDLADLLRAQRVAASGD